MCQLRRSSPGQFYRLSLAAAAAAAQFLILVAIVRHEANHTCLTIQANSLQSSQAAGVTSPPHTTWTQTASQPPTTTDPQFLSYLLDTAKSFLSKFNIQNLCHTLHSLFFGSKRPANASQKSCWRLMPLLLVS